jgi:hypothetical protein
MTEAIVLLCSGLLALAILGVEFARGRVRGGIDFLRAGSLFYLISYAIAPVFLQLENPVEFRAGTWSFALRTPFRDAAFAEASVLALLGYGFLLAGYWLAAPRKRSVVNLPPVRSRAYLWVVGLGIGGVGLLALVVYATSIGGWVVFVVQALAFRGTNPPVVSQWAFLKNVVPLVIGAVVVFYALRQYHQPGFARSLATLLCGLFFGAALAFLFHMAGRASFAAFLLTLPLISVVQRDRISPRHVIVGLGVLVGLVLFGKALFTPSVLLTDQAVAGAPAQVLRSFLREFTFPIVTLANAILAVPDLIEWRWFYDFPLSIIYLVPQRLTGLVHEPTVTMLNTMLFRADGGIPVDILSLGYFSAFVPGVILTAGGMGAVLGLGERLFPAGSDPLMAGLRVSWLLLLAFRIMYADPQLFWQPGLYLVFTTVAIVLPRWLGRLLSSTRPGLAVATAPLQAGR